MRTLVKKEKIPTRGRDTEQMVNKHNSVITKQKELSQKMDM